MIDSSSVNSVFDAAVVDPEGERIGTVKQVYLDPDTGQPLFATVATGLFGASESFVPLRDAAFDGEELRVGYDKDTVKDAPRIDADGAISDVEQDRIWDYYDGLAEDESNEGVAAEMADGPSERVRLRKYVITEQEGVVAPLQYEEVTLEGGSAATRSDAAPGTRPDDRSGDGPKHGGAR